MNTDRRILLNIINRGYSDKLFIPLTLVSKRYSIAKSIQKHWSTISKVSEPQVNYSDNEDLQKIVIEEYRGKNIGINKIQSYLKTKKIYTDNYVKIIVHGSVGTSEEIRYSDIDGLIIISNKALTDQKLLIETCYTLNRCLKFLYQYDPLQHHGWFVLTQKDLKNYPLTYFPPESLKYSKLISKNGEITITINDAEEVNYKLPFSSLTTSIKSEINQIDTYNTYQVKGILSQIMLLPALYLQAKNRKGVFKKFSFSEARKDFNDRDWQVMDEISDIRLNWHYKINTLQKYLLTRNNYLFRRLAVKYAPSVPDDIKMKLNDSFISRVLNLIDQMEKNLKHNN